MPDVNENLRLDSDMDHTNMKQSDMDRANMKQSDMDADDIRPSLEQSEMQESVQIQKYLWAKEQLQRKREQEDQILEQMKQEERILQDIGNDMNENIAHTRDGRLYQDQIQSRVERQIYEMHDLSHDKLEGMREYKNAYYRGFALAMFILSIAVTACAGYLYGLTSQLCLVLALLTATEAALLVHNERGIWIWRMISKVINVFMLPLILLLFIAYQNQIVLYDMILAYGIYAVGGILIIATAAYFTYNPYRGYRRSIKEAKSTLRILAKKAKKEVRRNQKSRARQEIKDEKLRLKREKIEAKIQRKVDAKEARRLRKEEEKEAKVNKKAAAKEAKLQKKSEKKESFVNEVQSDETDANSEDFVASDLLMIKH